MKLRRIGKSNIQVPQLTLGTMSFNCDKKSVIKMLSKALDQGLIHIDTADLYGFGHNEMLIGNFLKHHRDQIVLTTKVGNHFNSQTEEWFWDPSKKYITRAVKKSLERLQTDYIDLYLLHGGTIEDPIDETIDAFDELKKAGTIRTYGISSIRLNVIKTYMKKSNIDAVMMQYNLLDRRPEELLDDLYEHQISVLARSPLAKGIISSKGDININEKASDGYLEYSKETLEKIVRELHYIDEPLEKLAFQYVLHHPAVVSAVFGASSEKQIMNNSAYVHMGAMEDDMYQRIQQITKPLYYKQHRD